MTLMMDELLVQSDDWVRRRNSSTTNTAINATINNAGTPNVGDLALAWFYIFNNSTTTAKARQPIPAGWTQVGTYHTSVTGGYWGEAFVCYKLLTAADLGSVVFTRAAEATTAVQWRMTYMTLQRPIKAITGSGAAFMSYNSVGTAPTLALSVAGAVPRVYGDYHSTGIHPTAIAPVMPTYTDPAFSPITNRLQHDYFRFEGYPVYNLSIIPTFNLTNTASHFICGALWVSFD